MQVFIFEGEAVECIRLVTAASVRAVGALADRHYPNHDLATRLQKPRGFIDRVRTIAAFPEEAIPHQHLQHFCFPASVCGPFPSEGEPAYFHTFSLTNEDGTRDHGACLTTLQAERYGLHGLLEGRTVARPLSIVVFSRWPLFRIYEGFLRQLWLERRQHGWDCAREGSPLPETIRRFVRALAAREVQVQRALSHGLLLPLDGQLAAVMRALRWQPEPLAAVLLGMLTNRKMLVVSSDVALPPALIGCAVALLFPLEYPGVVVPLLPRSLHHDPATLINENVAPFLIGCDAELAADIAPFADDLLVLDLDAGAVRWPSPDPFEPWLRTPVAERLLDKLREFADSDDELSAAGVRAGCLRFVLDLVDLDDGALPNSAHPADRAVAAQWRLAGRMLEQLQAGVRALATSGPGELDEAELEQQAQLCRAAFVRELCASEPLGPRSGRDSNLPFVREAFGATACSEHLGEPAATRPRLPEPQWLHWRRLGAQFECSVREHAAGLQHAQGDLARALRAEGVRLAERMAPAHADDWPTPAPFAPPSVEVVSEFCDAFDAPVVGELLACAPCVLLDATIGTGLAGTPLALTGSPDTRGSLHSGRLYVTESHLCFQGASELAARKDVLALSQIAQLELDELEGSLTARTVSGIQLKLLAIHRVAALHALVSELVCERNNQGSEPRSSASRLHDPREAWAASHGLLT